MTSLDWSEYRSRLPQVDDVYCLPHGDCVRVVRVVRGEAQCVYEPGSEAGGEVSFTMRFLTSRCKRLTRSVVDVAQGAQYGH